MKKVMILIVLIAAMFVLAGCGSEDSNDDKSDVKLSKAEFVLKAKQDAAKAVKKKGALAGQAIGAICSTDEQCSQGVTSAGEYCNNGKCALTTCQVVTPGCTDGWISDGWCDESCNIAGCQSDGGDCKDKKTLKDPDACLAAGCDPVGWAGDAFCDASCNNVACEFDLGDCAEENAPVENVSCTPKTTAACTLDVCGFIDDGCGGQVQCTDNYDRDDSGYCLVGESCDDATDCITFFCDEGFCAAAKQCDDSDGKNYSLKGETNVYIYNQKAEDSCKDASTLNESFCNSEDKMDNELIPCKNECKDGACELSDSCTKVSVYNQGIVQHGKNDYGPINYYIKAKYITDKNAKLYMDYELLPKLVKGDSYTFVNDYYNGKSLYLKDIISGQGFISAEVCIIDKPLSKNVVTQDVTSCIDTFSLLEGESTDALALGKKYTVSLNKVTGDLVNVTVNSISGELKLNVVTIINGLKLSVLESEFSPTKNVKEVTFCYNVG